MKSLSILLLATTTLPAHDRPYLLKAKLLAAGPVGRISSCLTWPGCGQVR